MQDALLRVSKSAVSCSNDGLKKGRPHPLAPVLLSNSGLQGF